MPQSVTREETSLVDQLRDELRGTEGLAFAVLFGSVAREQARPDSDIDVGIWPERDWSLGEELALQARLVTVTHKTVDLVRLDRASTLLAWEAAKHAVWLFGTHDAISQFQARAGVDYADFAADLRRASLAYLNHVAQS